MSLKPFVAYEASAGSGKTFTLSVRYVSLLFYDIRPEKILALTFTNKAANEMRQRILEVLSNLQSKEAELNEICKATSLDKNTVFKMQPRILNKFLKSDHKIMTIDSFLNLIVRNFSLYAGLSPDFKIAKIHTFLLQSEFLKSVRNSGKWDDLVWLALYENKKMNDIFSLFNYLYEKDMELPKNSNRSEIKSIKIEKELFLAFDRLASLVNSSEQASGRLKDMFKYETVSDISKKTWMDKESLKYQRSLFNKCHTPEMDEILQEVQRLLKSFYKSREDEIIFKLLDLYEIYKETINSIKISQAQLDFADLTNIAASVLQGIDSEFLYFRLDGKIEHLLIDEFQDTNIAQYIILKPIIEEIRSGIGTSDEIKSFFYVGDVKQSIYRFRGGNSNLFGFVKQRHEIELEYLETNYRSSKSVVEFVNAAFKDIIDGYHPQKVNSSAFEGSVAVEEAEDINALLLDKVKRLKNAGVSYEDIAILVFTNNDVVDIKESIENEFGNIPIVTDSSKRLIFQNDVKAVIELIKYLYFEQEIFLRNFNSLSGCEKSVDIAVYKKELSASFIRFVHRLTKDFGLFKDDANLLKFIEICSGFKDAEEFIYGYELLDSPMLKGSHEGLRILTIHKSKGLEFGHVIVLDRTGRQNNKKDSLIFSYEGIELQKISYRFSNRDRFDAEYKISLDKEDEMAKRDLVNTLYVAFTRAKNSLSVLKKEKNSVFDVIGLQKTAIGILGLEKDLKQKEKFFGKIFFEYQGLNYGRQTLEIKKEKQSEDFDFEAVDIGSGLHYALEIMDGFEIKSIDTAMTAVKNRFALEKRAYDKIKNMLSLLLNDVRFKEAVNGKHYKERSFIIDGEIGVIDLYIVDGNELRVIDYKTGAKNDKYPEQIRRYTNALKKFYPDKEITGYLYYITEKNIETEKVK